ncbi:hypothetical protein [Trinickia acidisoli]|uniref:hypothetical protein n=1 Tax=Trinickia acidisoli TaxID=2767482 RepID=UPI001A8FCAC9|nr:hypothetical protein [Trinickia acidisoli]
MPLVVPLVDAVELESVLVDDVLELSEEVSPTWASAAAIAAASGFVLELELSLDDVSLVLLCDSSRFVLSVCQI